MQISDSDINIYQLAGVDGWVPLLFLHISNLVLSMESVWQVDFFFHRLLRGPFVSTRRLWLTYGSASLPLSDAATLVQRYSFFCITQFHEVVLRFAYAPDATEENLGFWSRDVAVWK